MKKQPIVCRMTARKTMAVILAGSLLWTSGNVGQVAAAAPEIFSLSSNLPQFRLTPPVALGRVTDYFNADSRPEAAPLSNASPAHPLVILIQDLHAHYGVQKNIAGILDFLADKLAESRTGAPVRESSRGAPAPPFALAVEGASGPVDSSLMALFPDAGLKEETSQFLMREGELTGAEYFAVKHRLPHLLVGVENQAYYTLHRDLFRKTFEQRGRLVQALQAIQNDINALPRRIYKGRVKALYREEIAYGAGKISELDYIAELAAQAKADGMDLKIHFPTLASFITNGHVGLGGNTSPEALLGDTANFLESVEGALSPEEKKDLKILARNEDLSTYYLYLRALVYQHRLFLTVSPELAQYMEYLYTRRTAGMDRVRHETKELAYQLQERVAGTQREKDLLQVRHDLDLLLRVADLQATETEVRDFAPRLPQFLALARVLLSGTAASANRSIGEPKPSSMLQGPEVPAQSLDAPKVRRLISSSMDYYVMAMLRNQPMVDNTLALLNLRAPENPPIPFSTHRSPMPRFSDAPTRPNVAVLVAGGFHTGPMTQILRDKNISYLVITPVVDKITDDDHALYEKRLNGETLTDQEILADVAKSDRAGEPSRFAFLRRKDQTSLACTVVRALLLSDFVFRSTARSQNHERLMSALYGLFKNNSALTEILHQADSRYRRTVQSATIERAQALIGSVLDGNPRGAKSLLKYYGWIVSDRPARPELPTPEPELHTALTNAFAEEGVQIPKALVSGPTAQRMGNMVFQTALVRAIALRLFGVTDPISLADGKWFLTLLAYPLNFQRILEPLNDDQKNRAIDILISEATDDWERNKVIRLLEEFFSGQAATIVQARLDYWKDENRAPGGPQLPVDEIRLQQYKDHAGQILNQLASGSKRISAAQQRFNRLLGQVEDFLEQPASSAAEATDDIVSFHERRPHRNSNYARLVDELKKPIPYGFPTTTSLLENFWRLADANSGQSKNQNSSQDKKILLAAAQFDLLSQLAMRVWDDGPASARANRAQVDRLMQIFQRNNPNNRFADSLPTLYAIKLGDFMDDERALREWIQRTADLFEDDRQRMEFLLELSHELARHFRILETEPDLYKQVVGNGVDFAIAAEILIPILERYQQLVLNGIPLHDEARKKYAEALADIYANSVRKYLWDRSQFLGLNADTWKKGINPNDYERLSRYKRNLIFMPSDLPRETIDRYFSLLASVKPPLANDWQALQTESQGKDIYIPEGHRVSFPHQLLVMLIYEQIISPGGHFTYEVFNRLSNDLKIMEWNDRVETQFPQSSREFSSYNRERGEQELANLVKDARGSQSEISTFLPILGEALVAFFTAQGFDLGSFHPFHHADTLGILFLASGFVAWLFRHFEPWLKHFWPVEGFSKNNVIADTKTFYVSRVNLNELPSGVVVSIQSNTNQEVYRLRIGQKGAGWQQFIALPNASLEPVSLSALGTDGLLTEPIAGQILVRAPWHVVVPADAMVVKPLTEFRHNERERKIRDFVSEAEALVRELRIGLPFAASLKAANLMKSGERLGLRRNTLESIVAEILKRSETVDLPKGNANGNGMIQFSRWLREELQNNLAVEHLNLHVSLNEFQEKKQVETISPSVRWHIAAYLLLAGELKLAVRIATGHYPIFLYGTDDTKYLIEGKATTHAGINTGAIHIAKGAFLDLQKKGFRYAAARIGHEAKEILRWREEGQRRGIPKGHIREWIQNDIEEHGLDAEVYQLDDQFHHEGVVLEQKIGGKDADVNLEPNRDMHDIVIQAHLPAEANSLFSQSVTRRFRIEGEDSNAQLTNLILQGLKAGHIAEKKNEFEGILNVVNLVLETFTALNGPNALQLANDIGLHSGRDLTPIVYDYVVRKKNISKNINKDLALEVLKKMLGAPTLTGAASSSHLFGLIAETAERGKTSMTFVKKNADQAFETMISAHQKQAAKTIVQFLNEQYKQTISPQELIDAYFDRVQRISNFFARWLDHPEILKADLLPLWKTDPIAAAFAQLQLQRGDITVLKKVMELMWGLSVPPSSKYQYASAILGLASASAGWPEAVKVDAEKIPSPFAAATVDEDLRQSFYAIAQRPLNKDDESFFYRFIRSRYSLPGSTMEEVAHAALIWKEVTGRNITQERWDKILGILEKDSASVLIDVTKGQAQTERWRASSGTDHLRFEDVQEIARRRKESGETWPAAADYVGGQRRQSSALTKPSAPSEGVQTHDARETILVKEMETYFEDESWWRNSLAVLSGEFDAYVANETNAEIIRMRAEPFASAAVTLHRAAERINSPDAWQGSIRAFLQELSAHPTLSDREKMNQAINFLMVKMGVTTENPGQVSASAASGQSAVTPLHSGSVPTTASESSGEIWQPFIPDKTTLRNLRNNAKMLFEKALYTTNLNWTPYNGRPNLQSLFEEFDDLMRTDPGVLKLKERDNDQMIINKFVQYKFEQLRTKYASGSWIRRTWYSLGAAGLIESGLLLKGALWMAQQGLALSPSAGGWVLGVAAPLIFWSGHLLQLAHQDALGERSTNAFSLPVLSLTALTGFAAALLPHLDAHGQLLVILALTGVHTLINIVAYFSRHRRALDLTENAARAMSNPDASDVYDGQILAETSGHNPRILGSARVTLSQLMGGQA